MKFARFLFRDRVQWGVLDGDDLQKLRGDRFANARAGARICSRQEARLLAPLEPTSKVIGIAANYGERDERDGPGLFMKPPGTNVAHLDPIVLPRAVRTVIHEAELGIVIGRTARQVHPDDGLDHVMGYTCVNDVSARETTASDIGRGTTMRWKHFDTFCPIGPSIATGLDGDNLRVQCRVNGRVDVDGNTSAMLWGVSELVAWVSEVMTLYPGDVIASGCPGTGEINPGDTVEVEVEGVGVLRNPVIGDG